MRSVHLSDLNLAARTLLAARGADRVALMETLVQDAHIADKFRKKTGKAHGLFGNGTLSAACMPYAKVPMPDRCDPQYLTCLGTVIQGLLGRETNDHL